MKRIILKRLSLVNFKGVRSLDVDFSKDITKVFGRNGSGKTTLFDAFTWVLFGKDSQGRKAFDIKTLDSQGIAIPRLPHEVKATIEVDGAEVTLTRRYNEKWVKRKGSATEEFTGHEEERLYNDVPCNLKEWNEKIADICPEVAFKFITSPSCFASQKAEAQREMLIKMAGDITDKDVAEASGGRQDFIDLLASLTGKTLDEYKREISAKKRLIKAEIEALPQRIDERRRDNEQYADTDYEQVEAELKEKEKAWDEIEAQLTQASARINSCYKAKEETASRLSEAKEKQLQLASDIRNRMMEQYFSLDRKRGGLLSQIYRHEATAYSAEQKIRGIDADLERLEKERNALRQQYRAINAETLNFGTNDFICPTCHQPLDPDNIEKKKAEMQANFNCRKSSAIEENKRKGFACKEAIEKAQAEREKLQNEVAQADSEVAKLKGELSLLPEAKKPTEEEVRSKIAESEECAKLKIEIERLADELDSIGNYDIDTAELRSAKAMLTDSITDLRVMLDSRKYVKRNNDRIAELEQQLRSQSEALAQLEGIEFTIAEFSKARIEAVENKINSLFTLVRFKMYDQQINGGEVETCEATVGGIPYSSQNNAMRINMGLDIINAICKYQGIAAPIFIDNCESILEPLQTIGQQVRLYVNASDKLIVK